MPQKQVKRCRRGLHLIAPLKEGFFHKLIVPRHLEMIGNSLSLGQRAKDMDINRS